MGLHPIPQRLPPLAWRKPAFLWTPLALALAIGWPGALFYFDAAPQRFMLVAGVIVFAIALTTLGVGWAMGRAPRTRREVVTHVLGAALVVCVLAPFVLTRGASNFDLTMSVSVLPLALLMGLPIALISGIVFAFVALTQPRADNSAPLDDDVFVRGNNVQPFR